MGESFHLEKFMRNLESPNVLLKFEFKMAGTWDAFSNHSNQLTVVIPVDSVYID